MRSRGRRQFTIGQMMALITVLAGLLALPHFQTPMEIQVAACVIALLPILLLANSLVEVMFGIRCPGCARWTLRRRSTSSSYYRCTGCRGRFKRFGLGPWLDAS